MKNKQNQTTKANLLLHPVRSRIVRLLLEKEFTVSDIKEQLGDVPQATLYRNINLLEKQRLITVVREHKVRGTYEKVYTATLEQANVDKKEMQNSSIKQHKQYFNRFISIVLADFERYIDNPKSDPSKDGLAYKQAPLYCTDDEFTTLSRDMGELFATYLKNRPSPERKERIISTIIIP